jgi:hypothetical protein
MCIGTVFAVISLVSALISNCRDIKGNLYCYTVLSAVALALSVAAMSLMATITADAASQLAPCDLLSAAEIAGLQRISGPDFFCANLTTISRTTSSAAAEWTAAVSVFFVGNCFIIGTLLTFLSMNACCSKADDEDRRPLRPPETAPNYGV